MKKPFFTWDGDTLVLNILGTPNAKRDAIGKVKGHQLCVSVTAVPRAGRATDHMVRFLADEFGVSVSDIQVVSGRMNVNKLLRIKAPKRLPSVFSPMQAAARPYGARPFPIASPCGTASFPSMG